MRHLKLFSGLNCWKIVNNKMHIIQIQFKIRRNKMQVSILNRIFVAKYKSCKLEESVYISYEMLYSAHMSPPLLLSWKRFRSKFTSVLHRTIILTHIPIVVFAGNGYAPTSTTSHRTCTCFVVNIGVFHTSLWFH